MDDETKKFIEMVIQKLKYLGMDIMLIYTDLKNITDEQAENLDEAQKHVNFSINKLMNLISVYESV